MVNKETQKIRLPEADIKKNLELFNNCAAFLTHIAFESGVSGFLNKGERLRCNSINNALMKADKINAYLYEGFSSKFTMAQTYLTNVAINQQKRFAEFTHALADPTTSDPSSLARLEQLEELHQKILKSARRMQPRKFIRLLQRINQALVERDYKLDNFSFVINDMLEHYKRALLNVRFSNDTKDNTTTNSELKNKKRRTKY